MKIEIVHARAHMAEEYKDYLEGQRAVRLIDDDGEIRGELVWRLAGRWRCVFEIKELGIFRDSDRRQGLGTLLIQHAMEDMRDFVARFDARYKPWKVFLFCEEKNSSARSFYEATGFLLEANLEDFYGPSVNAIIYSRAI